MSMNDSESTTGIGTNGADPPRPSDDSDDTTLRDRIAANPRPATIWFAGFAVLVLVELGRFAGAGLNLAAILELFIGATFGTAQFIGGNVASTAGATAGAVAFVVSLVLVLAMLAGPVRSWLPFSPSEVFDVDVTPDRRLFVDRLFVTAGLGVLTALLMLTPVGDAVDAVIAGVAGVLESMTSLPTITSRELISNQGHLRPEGGWDGTFLGLPPAQAWFIRVVVVYVYAFVLLYWLWRGYVMYRRHYREADWAPIDDSIDRLRGHPWGKAGLVIVIMFFVMAAWAPALGPVTAEENLYSPYQHEITYLNDGEVKTTLHGTANIQSRSNGDSNVGPLEYDQYNRWAPFGTNSDGKDLFTFLVYGARTSLVIGLIATGLGAGIALALAMVTAYYRGLVDLVAVIGSDSIQSVPFILLVLLLYVVLREAEHPIVGLYDGGILLALILAFTSWPGLWRSIRGPSLQIAQAEWIDAAKSFGQRPSVTMRKHMAPYVVIYLIIYASLVLGTIVITTAALSFLGLGISPPTPEWGRMIADGRSYVSTRSWHVATIPGVMIVLVVTGFNAFGDALRDALDVEADVGGGGGGA